MSNNAKGAPMKQKLIVFPLGIAVLTLLLFAGLTGCDDNSTGPDDTGGSSTSYYPMNTGNWWKYRSVETDSTGSEKAGTESYDSTVVAGQVQIGGRTAWVVLTYTENEPEADTSYMYTDQSGVWLYFGGDSLLGVSLTMPSQWVKFADFSQSQWTILELNLSDTVEYQGGKIIFKHAKATGYNEGKETITVQGQQYTNAVRIKVEIEFEAEYDFGFVKQQTNVKQEIVTWFAADIGPVLDRTSIVVTAGGMPMFATSTKSELVGYHISK